MAIPSKDNQRKFAGKFARTLLGATCLTAATGAAALATPVTYTESSDWGDTIGSPTSLAAAANPGMTILNGEVSSRDTDFVELTGLGSGTFSVTADEGESTRNAIVSLFTTGDVAIGSATTFGSHGGASNPADLGPFTIPGNGDVIVEIRQGGSGEGTQSYTITLNSQSSVPEPATFGMVGLGLAGAVALSRKRRKQ